MFDTVISACCARDIAVAVLSARGLVENVAARRYILAVPRAEVSQFSARVSARFDVVAEDEFLGGVTIDAVRRALSPARAKRAGWYLQQFVKLAAARDVACTSLIWDADTVLLREPDFGPGATKPGEVIRAYGSREYHAPYFETFEHLTGLKRAADRSFIAQCLCVRGTWIEALLSTIENRAGKDWVGAILAVLPGQCPSEFSEYETIGNFVLHRFPGELEFHNRRWSRFGHALIGGPEKLTPFRATALARAYDFIALEHGIRPSLRRRLFETCRFAGAALAGQP